MLIGYYTTTSKIVSRNFDPVAYSVGVFRFVCTYYNCCSMETRAPHTGNDMCHRGTLTCYGRIHVVIYHTHERRAFRTRIIIIRVSYYYMSSAYWRIISRERKTVTTYIIYYSTAIIDNIICYAPSDSLHCITHSHTIKSHVICVYVSLYKNTRAHIYVLTYT